MAIGWSVFGLFWVISEVGSPDYMTKSPIFLNLSFFVSNYYFDLYSLLLGSHIVDIYWVFFFNFDWSALQTTKCQTLRKFWHWELFWRDLHSIWHLFIFLGRTSKKQHPVSQKHPKKVLSGAWLRIAFSVNPMTPIHNFPIIIKRYIINSGDYDFQRVRAVEMKKRSLLRNRLALAVLSKCSLHS